MLAPPSTSLLLAPRHAINRGESLRQLSRVLRPLFWFLGKAGRHQAFKRRRDRWDPSKAANSKWGARRIQLTRAAGAKA